MPRSLSARLLAAASQNRSGLLPRYGDAGAVRKRFGPGFVTARGLVRALAAAVLLTPGIAASVAAEPVTIAALGDSLTQGYGLPQGAGLVPQLEAWLAGQGAAAVIINAGVSGDTTAGGLSRIDWTLGPEVQALIVNLGGNDLLRGGDPALARANLDAILTKAGARGLPVLLVGVAAPGNFGAGYKADWDGMFESLAEAHDALVLTDFLAPLTADTAGALERYMQADGIHPNAEGVTLLVARLGPKVLELIARAGAE